MSSEPPTLASTGEFSVIDALVARTGQPASTLLGPGDDCAVVSAPDGRVVATVDVLVDGVHFRTDWATGEQIGRRAALASLADVAAMGASPTALLVGLSAPGETPIELVMDIGRGLDAEASRAGAGIVGGDITRSPVLTISVTALGDLAGREPVRRSGARVGDVVAVNGRLGWAAAGLAVLSRGFRSPAALVGAYRVPEPPLAAGVAGAQAGATAMIDVSDGLVADLGHIADESGVGIEVATRSLPVHDRLTEVASALGRDPMQWVLTGGDDHALAATFPPGRAPSGDWVVIGVVREGSGVLVDGTLWDSAGGWDHFA
ncbi:thiamine-phosphate kinase [Nakamurella sp.]|uniref:thiamine-phosphate kinase n=1 Tax=Nakamurella sp. TaxID=1869182 RepID=UPI00378503C4